MEKLRFQEFANSNPAAHAIKDPLSRHWSRGEIASLANKLSRFLISVGAQHKSVMAIIAPNCAEFIAAYLAGTQIGMYVVPVNWHLSPTEVRHILENSAAKVVFAHPRLQAPVDAALAGSTDDAFIRISLGDGWGKFRGLDAVISQECGEALSNTQQGRPLLYTSATTGRPKGVLLPLEHAERALDLTITQRIAAGTRPEEHVLVCAAMLYHGAPLDCVIIALHMGHTIVLLETLDAESVLRAISSNRATMAYVVPSIFARLLALDSRTKAALSASSLKRVIHTGAACAAQIKRQMIDWWGPIFWEAYGAAEGSGTVASSTEWLANPGTVGRALPGTTLKILDDDGNELPSSHIGTIYLTRFTGERFEYLGDSEKTRSAYRGDFFTVGDLGFVDNHGFLYLTDRSTDVINVQGVKIYPSEIELTLAAHPAVAECAVLGVPDVATGEAVVAAVTLRERADRTRIKLALIRHLLKEVSLIKAPRHVFIVDALPRDACGKLQRRRLRDICMDKIREREAQAKLTQELSSQSSLTESDHPIPPSGNCDADF